MTRFARGGDANKKKVNNALSWEELTSSSQLQQAQASTRSSSKISTGTASASHLITKTSMNVKKKRTKGKGFSSSNQMSASVNALTKIKNKNNMSNISQQSKETGDGTVMSVTDQSDKNLKSSSAMAYQNSKSLIEELEEMDKQQLAEISKQVVEEHTQQKDTSKNLAVNVVKNQKQLEKIKGSLDKKQKRSEERRLKRQKAKTNKMVCYHCRQSGHGVADCPKALADAEHGSGVCYRCGSTEHDASQCTARIDHKQGDFPFAKCFICQEMGHLSKSCPDNPKGLYPMGGCCKHCESVEHMSWNCPQVKNFKGVKEIHLKLYSNTSHQSADAEEFTSPRGPPKTMRKKPKVVMF